MRKVRYVELWSNEITIMQGKASLAEIFFQKLFGKRRACHNDGYRAYSINYKHIDQTAGNVQQSSHTAGNVQQYSHTAGNVQQYSHTSIKTVKVTCNSTAIQPR